MSSAYSIRTFGCQMNEHDSERIAGSLEEAGLRRAADEAEADVVVLNTCCIRENADNKLYGALGHLKASKAANPDLRIVVAGCLAQKDGEVVRERAPHVDLVVGTHNAHRVATLLDAGGGPSVEIWDESDLEELFPAGMAVRRDSDYAAWVTIQVGCDNSCAFCIVPSVRGKEVSRPLGQIVDEVTDLVERGVVEVTLLGQNVNSYGRDITADMRRLGEGSTRVRPLFADLLRALGGIEGLERVRFTSPHPKDLRPETIAAMAEVPNVCPHLHLPLQSGSDRILAAMHRGYTAERYLNRLDMAVSKVPDLAVTTDVIVGFPGETEEDFEETLRVCARAEYDGAFTFVFSPRPGTEAAEMSDEFVPRDVAAERMERLRVVVENSSAHKYRLRVGLTETVLVEGFSKKNPDVTTGRTAQNKLVHFAAPNVVRTGSFAEVSVVDAARHHLLGELVDVTAPPKHKTRIPVVSG